MNTVHTVYTNKHRTQKPNPKFNSLLCSLFFCANFDCVQTKRRRYRLSVDFAIRSAQFLIIRREETSWFWVSLRSGSSTLSAISPLRKSRTIFEFLSLCVPRFRIPLKRLDSNRYVFRALDLNLLISIWLGFQDSSAVNRFFLKIGFWFA